MLRSLPQTFRFTSHISYAVNMLLIISLVYLEILSLMEALAGLSTVIMSNYYDLPFNDILDWRKFSVILKETDVYRLKDILKSISPKHFMILNQNLVKIQKHFNWNTPPVRLDAFHMVMYELWLRRHLIRY
ncbi:hypothetical protein V8G54_031853 [Vigna mungo]|uniref:Exostosin GT47 domain-containing protein n=1 Tax=Vigna mungo TaxID=3915 RepID=A0AAQ3MKX2_VIGMU